MNAEEAPRSVPSVRPPAPVTDIRLPPFLASRYLAQFGCAAVDRFAAVPTHSLTHSLTRSISYARGDARSNYEVMLHSSSFESCTKIGNFRREMEKNIQLSTYCSWLILATSMKFDTLW